jgi:hypothetical protein
MTNTEGGKSPLLNLEVGYFSFVQGSWLTDPIEVVTLLVKTLHQFSSIPVYRPIVIMVNLPIYCLSDIGILVKVASPPMPGPRWS